MEHFAEESPHCGIADGAVRRIALALAEDESVSRVPASNVVAAVARAAEHRRTFPRAVLADCIASALVETRGETALPGWRHVGIAVHDPIRQSPPRSAAPRSPHCADRTDQAPPTPPTAAPPGVSATAPSISVGTREPVGSIAPPADRCTARGMRRGSVARRQPIVT
jgi:hypothetical protein